MTLVVTRVVAFDDRNMTVDEAATVAMAPEAIGEILKQLDPEDLKDLINVLQLFWLQNYECVGKGIPASSIRHEVYTYACPVEYCLAPAGDRCRSRQGARNIWPHAARYPVEEGTND